MKFVHIADTHLGFRQYGLFDREIDFYNVFDQCVDKIIQEKPDFVIHSGDLFEFSKPPINALLKVQNGLKKLNDAKIPIYAIPGNHDIIMRKNAIPPQKLYSNLGLKLIDLENKFFVEKNVFIGGIPYLSKSYAHEIKEFMNNIEKTSQKYKKKILVLHQSIDRYLPYDPELKIGDIPKTFNYYAFGHIHERIVDDFGNGKLAYPGSTEIWRVDELKGYKRNGKGFFLVDIGGDMPDVENVDIDLPREVIQENIEYGRLEDEIKRILSHVTELPKKPLLHLIISGGNFDRSEVYDMLNESFHNNCLSFRPTYNIQSLMEEDIQDNMKEGIDAWKILEEKLEGFNDDRISKLAINLLNDISNNNLKRAEDVAQDFYEATYDNQ